MAPSKALVAPLNVCRIPRQMSPFSAIDSTPVVAGDDVIQDSTSTVLGAGAEGQAFHEL